MFVEEFKNRSGGMTRNTYVNHYGGIERTTYAAPPVGPPTMVVEQISRGDFLNSHYQGFNQDMFRSYSSVETNVVATTQLANNQILGITGINDDGSLRGIIRTVNTDSIDITERGYTYSADNQFVSKYIPESDNVRFVNETNRNVGYDSSKKSFYTEETFHTRIGEGEKSRVITHTARDYTDVEHIRLKDKASTDDYFKANPGEKGYAEAFFKENPDASFEEYTKLLGEKRESVKLKKQQSDALLKGTRSVEKMSPAFQVTKGIGKYILRDAKEESTGKISESSPLKDQLDLEMGKEANKLFFTQWQRKFNLNEQQINEVNVEANKLFEEKKRKLYQKNEKKETRLQEKKKAKDISDERFATGKAKAPKEALKDNKFKTGQFKDAKSDKFTSRLDKLRGKMADSKDTKQYEKIAKKVTKKKTKAVAKASKKALKQTPKALRLARAIRSTANDAPVVAIVLGSAILLFLPLIIALFLEAAGDFVTSTATALRLRDIFVKTELIRKSSKKATSVENIVYREMLEYFDGNKFAAAAVVGNIYAETNCRPNNLQNIVNPYINPDGSFNFDNNGGQTSRYLGWGDGVSDEEYTEGLTYGIYIGKHYQGITKTIDGITYNLNSTRNKFACDEAGYGLCQWTYVTRKAALYDFAQEYAKEHNAYYSGYADLSDPKMQAKYIQHELNTLPEYRHVTSKMKAASSIEEASDIWMLNYERPYDQSERKREQRREYSRQKYKELKNVRMDDFDEVDGTYFTQSASGPCWACSLANMSKRYCYSCGDDDWDDIVPHCLFDDGTEIYYEFVNPPGKSYASWDVTDSSGQRHSEYRTGWGRRIGTYRLHGINFKILESENITKSELIEMLDNHPEGIVVWQGGHAKLITRYDSSIDDFYCVDPIYNYSHGYERPLNETWGWTSISGYNCYNWIATTFHKSDD